MERDLAETVEQWQEWARCRLRVVRESMVIVAGRLHCWVVLEMKGD